MTTTSTVGEKFQTVVPLQIRRRCGIRKGATLQWTQEANSIRVIKLEPPPTPTLGKLRRIKGKLYGSAGKVDREAIAAAVRADREEQR